MFSEIANSSVEAESIWRKAEMMSKGLLKVLLKCPQQVQVGCWTAVEVVRCVFKQSVFGPVLK